MTATREKITVDVKGYGVILLEWLSAIDPYVRGRDVLLLGDGHTKEAELLLTLQPRSLHCLDRCDRSNDVLLNDRRVTYEKEYFDRAAVRKNVQTVFTRWPSTTGPGISRLVHPARNVIYIGRNDGVTACGYTDLWESLLGRELVAEHQSRWNDLLIYGAKTTRERTPRCREETHCTYTWAKA